MASQCKRQQCTIDRRGFRQELDSWRHKLIHCVGFESILEGLFDPELVEDLKLFKDFKPVAVSDWSFDENCLFCCLRRDKVKEHLIGLSKEVLEDSPKPLLVKDQTTISRLEKQAEEFLNAVLYRKDVPNFSDPDIPVVAREILQKMIRQFAAEYTSKTSSPQDSCSDTLPHSDQSLPTSPLLSGDPTSASPVGVVTVAGPAHNQNPVLSKLLMADQDAPLDLTIKKPPAEPREQDGVLDLSIKKNRNSSSSSSLPVLSSCLSPATSMLKGLSLRADGQVGLLMRSLQNGRRRENIGHSSPYKPSSSLAYSLHIKEEANLESDPESPLGHNHSSRPTDLFRNGSTSWNSKTHFGALLKLKAVSEASEHLTDIPKLLEAAGLLTKSLAYEKEKLQEPCSDHISSLSHSPSFDLKIPQVRSLAAGTDPSWDPLSTEFSGSLCENGLGKKPHSILPRQLQKKSNRSFSSGLEKEYCPYVTDRQALGGNYHPDSEADLGNKQPRKKRGRYRQYNTELLEEAIVVVIGGKMSVSKAQSIYGIPHSTLEYKVKERLGTLKHPPKKKLKLIGPVEEQDGSQCSERKELPVSQQDGPEKHESASDENGNYSRDGSLSSNEESPDFRAAKAKDLQSTSTLEQFMAKLCPHHQRQIVDAIGFLQTEVKALASSSTQQAFNSTSGIQSSACSPVVTTEKPAPELPRLYSESTPKSEVQNLSLSIPSSCSIKKVQENAVSLKTSVTTGPALDLCSPRPGSNSALFSATTNPLDTRHGDHAPLKMKIMASNVAAGKKLSCVLNATLSSHSDTSDGRQGHSTSSSRTETHSARLSSSVKRHNQVTHMHQARQRETLGNAKDTPAKLFSVHTSSPSDSQRTARKTPRASSDYRTRDPACSRMDPDLGHCDIVFIDKPITECFKEQQRNILRRRNARKSTRGHIYSDEIWELKTVRTLAGRGNCPNPMPELITLVTPKQILSKPEGVPPIDMPFVASCRESMNQQMSTEESDENVMPGAGDVVELADSEVDIVVETSQTDQCQSKEQSTSLSPENKETNLEQDITAHSGAIKGSDETMVQFPSDTDKNSESEPQEVLSESTMQTEAKLTAESLENTTIEDAETEVSVDILCMSTPAVQQNRSPLPLSHADKEMEKKESVETQGEQHQNFEPETSLNLNNCKLTEEPIKDLAPGPVLKDQEMSTSDTTESIIPLKTKGDNDNYDDNDNDSDYDYDVSSKTLDALLKELPPWRRKRGTVISLPKRLKQKEAVIVGYVNGRPISASDRSLRRRSANSSGSTKTPVKAGQNVANKTAVNPAIDSTVENKHLVKRLLGTCISSEAAVIKQGTDPSSDTASSPITKVPPKTKQMHTQKRIQHAQDILPFIPDQSANGPHSTESKWQLRSASQRPGTPQSLPTSITSNSPKPTAVAVQSTDVLLSFSLPSSDPGTLLPPISSSSLVAPQLSQENSVRETPMELNTTSEEIQTNEVQSKSPTRQKQRSAKVAVDDHQDDIQQIRHKRVLRKDTESCDVALPQKLNVSSLEDGSTNDDHCNSDVLEKPTRMPLRSESNKADMVHQSVTQPPQLDTKKLSLRSQTLVAPSTSTLIVSGRQSDAASFIRIMPERISKTQVKSAPLSGAPVLRHNPCIPAITTRTEPPKQNTNKFFGALTGEENQHLITNLNMKYDKMQKGWVQMDKEGQPATRYKNKADRQAAIWKSKRRARKPKSLEHQKYSPVQMLFMKGFNLSNICRWFLESTETKSLVIVKKVNTRLPSETQLCFHSSSSATGTSQGVFPSLQAERLKKHLKKFAIASPVKSNPKSQKLIAKALEHEANPVKGKERREPPNTTQTLTKSHSSAKVRAQICESQKSSSRSKNPASARILRKYSNIRGKMQVQQTNGGTKNAAKTLKASSMKTLATKQSPTKSELKPFLKAQKSPVAVSKQMKESAAKMERRKKLASKRRGKHPIQERIANVYTINRASRDATKKLPKRSSQRLGSPKISECNIVDASKSKIDNKKPSEAEKAAVEKPAVNKMHAVKVHSKELLNSTFAEIKVTENTTEIPQQSTDLKGLTSPDQVLTRSQRKIETAVPLRGNHSSAIKRATTFMTTQKSTKKAKETMLTRKRAFHSARRSQAALLPRSATKSASKRVTGLLETPAKRTRTSFSK